MILATDAYERELERVKKIQEAYSEIPAGAYGEARTRQLIRRAEAKRATGDYHLIHEALVELSEWHPGFPHEAWPWQ